MGKGKARAATGMTEVVCWQFMLGGVGGVGALIFFLVLGAMDGMEPKAKPAEILAPVFVPSQCGIPTDLACIGLKDDIDAALTDAKKAELLANPCSLPNDSDVVAKLGVYWKAICGAVFTPPACAPGTEVQCEIDAAIAEAHCAFLGLSPAPMSMSSDDDMDPAACAAALSGDSVTQSQADRCATDRSMAWETLSFMTGGDFVTNNRCSAVTFAAVVAKGTDVDSCQTAGAYNQEQGADAIIGAMPIGDACAVERVCAASVVEALVGAVDQGSYAEMNRVDPPPIGTASAAGYDAATKVATALCAVGYQAVAGTAGYRCSHVPLTDAAGFAIDTNGARVEPALAIGSWVGGLECEKRACPTLCGTALGPAITGQPCVASDATTACDISVTEPWQCVATGTGTCAFKTEQRPPPEGLSDTCLSGVFGDERQIQCTKGYRPAKGTNCGSAANCPETPMVCQVTGGNQDDPVWAGASCSPMQCYQTQVPNEGGAAPLPAQGSVEDPFDYPNGCATGFFQVGELKCQTNLFYQGGGCSDRFVSTMTDSAFTTTEAVVTGSSNNNLARDVFDNDPLTYWFSTRQDAVTATDPDWLQVVIRDPIVPLGYSIQLGKSTDWLSFLIKPKRHQLKGKLSTAAVDWHHYNVQNDALATYGPASSPQWNPACNDVTIDPLNCWACDRGGDEEQVHCPATSNCVVAGGSADSCSSSAPDQSDCSYPTSNPCGPTAFPIYAQNAGGSFDTFRLEFSDEFPTPGRTTRYGQIYVQDVHIMSAEKITTPAHGTATPRAGGATCCGAGSTCTPLDDAGSYSMAADVCIRLVAAADGTTMQFRETGAGTGDCYSVDTEVADVAFPMPIGADGTAEIGDHTGAVCFDIA